MPKLFKDCGEAELDLTDLGLTRYSSQGDEKPSYWWKPTENLIMGYLGSDVEAGDRWRYYVKSTTWNWDWDRISRAEFKLILQRLNTKVADIL